MKKYLIILLGVCCQSLYAADGIIDVKSRFGVTHTADRFIGIVKKKGFNVMAHIKHSEVAKRVGVNFAPTELIIFGNPKIGAPLMACERSIGIDLPQKVLVWADNMGQAWLSYNDPVYIANRHKLKENCRGSLKKIASALNKLTHKAGGTE